MQVAVDADPNGSGFIAECPDVPGAVARGETEALALENLAVAIKAVVDVKMNEHLATLAPDMSTVSTSGRVVILDEDDLLAEGYEAMGADMDAVHEDLAAASFRSLK